MTGVSHINTSDVACNKGKPNPLRVGSGMHSYLHGDDSQTWVPWHLCRYQVAKLLLSTQGLPDEMRLLPKSFVVSAVMILVDNYTCQDARLGPRSLLRIWIRLWYGDKSLLSLIYF